MIDLSLSIQTDTEKGTNIKRSLPCMYKPTKPFPLDAQIANMVKKMSKAIGMLRYSKQYLPIKSVQTMYKSLIEPYFRYCCPVWGVCGITAPDKLQKLQNRAARIVTNSPSYNASAFPIIRKLGWQTVNDLIVNEIL